VKWWGERKLRFQHPRLFKGEVCEDLLVLLARRKAQLLEAHDLTTLPSGSSARRSFRLDFENGEVLKSRCFESVGDAKRVEKILGLLNPEHFPRMVRRRGCAMLLQWIEGASVASKDWNSESLRRIGSLHAQIHMIPVSRFLRALSPTLSGWLIRLDHYLSQLHDIGAINDSDVSSAQRIIRSRRPERLSVGIVHKDLCAENIVTSPDGEIWVVDNETLSVDSPDYDLTRTFYRWPMDASQTEAYLQGYSCHRSTTEFLTFKMFWTLAVLAESALFRILRNTEMKDHPLSLLQDLLRRTDM